MTSEQMIAYGYPAPNFSRVLAEHDSARTNWRTRRMTGTEDWLLIVSLDGEYAFYDGSSRYVCGQMDIVIVLPHVAHNYGPNGPGVVWNRIWFHFHPRVNWHMLVESWPRQAGGVLCLTIDQPGLWESLRHCAWTALFHASQKSGCDDELAKNSLERLLLLINKEMPACPRATDSRVSLVTAYIDQNLNADLSIGSLAGMANLSPSRFVHLFRSEFGMTVGDYVDRQRSEFAMSRLVRTTVPAFQIAEGLSMNPAQFSAWFKKQTGLSPTMFRRRNGQLSPYTAGLTSPIRNKSKGPAPK